MLIVNAEQTRRLLPMAECIEVIDRAMRAASAGKVDTPERIIAPLADEISYFIVMPGSTTESTVYGAKLVSLHPGNPSRGRPAVQGFVTLFDGITGSPSALIDGAEITRIRTAAASALATRELAREDATTHGILGAGVQAASHMQAIACVRGIERVLVWARDNGKAQQFAAGQSGHLGFRVTAVENAEEAAACDIVSVVTNSPEPVLRGAWLRPGTHLNLVGSHEPQHREADSDAVTRAALYVDSLGGALSEAGDLLIPIAENRLSPEDIIGEIGEVLAGTAPGRRDDQQITLYKSLGLVAQDLFAAEYVLRKAREQGAGTRIDFP
jgi:ornithine cyclodeaminase/alanine dehydrogenase-like protein (mu-crystallin family)